MEVESLTKQVALTETIPLRERRSSYRVAGGWVTRRPILTILTAFVVFVLVEYFSLPSVSSIERLRTVNPRTTALMEARKDDRGTGWKIAHRWARLSNISPHLVHAVIVAEDGMFYKHEGFDWYEVQESFERNLQEGRIVRGASTITQQLAKNLYLSTSRDPVRKLKEYFITRRLESTLSKDRILELYLNVIEWGDGVFGVEAASQEYFGKSAADLTREEAVRLAAVIPNPRRYPPNEDFRYILYHTRILLERMGARGW